MSFTSHRIIVKCSLMPRAGNPITPMHKMCSREEGREKEKGGRDRDVGKGGGSWGMSLARIGRPGPYFQTDLRLPPSRVPFPSLKAFPPQTQHVLEVLLQVNTPAPTPTFRLSQERLCWPPTAHCPLGACAFPSVARCWSDNPISQLCRLTLPLAATLQTAHAH